LNALRQIGLPCFIVEFEKTRKGNILTEEAKAEVIKHVGLHKVTFEVE